MTWQGRHNDAGLMQGSCAQSGMDFEWVTTIEKQTYIIGTTPWLSQSEYRRINLGFKHYGDVVLDNWYYKNLFSRFSESGTGDFPTGHFFFGALGMVQWSPTALKATLVPGPGLSSAVPSFSKTMVLNVVSSPCTWLWLGLPWETQGKVGGIWVMECVIWYFMYIESFSVSCFLCSTVSYKFAESIICAPESIMDSRVPMDSW